MKGTVLFITGIDTNIGKTFATGMIACALAEKGKKVLAIDWDKRENDQVEAYLKILKSL